MESKLVFNSSNCNSKAPFSKKKNKKKMHYFISNQLFPSKKNRHIGIHVR